MLKVLAYLCVAAAVAAGPARAQEGPGITKQFAAFLRDDPSYGNWLIEKLQAFEPAPMLEECGDLKIVSHSFDVIDPPIIPIGMTVPQSGQWVEHINVDRCGTATRRSLVVTARGLDQLEGGPLMPGDTLADPLLQQDATKFVWPQAAQRLACDPRQVFPRDSVVAGGARPKAPWLERWTFGGCGKKTVLEIDFTPERDGTRFSVRPQR